MITFNLIGIIISKSRGICKYEYNYMIFNSI
jgi:hypothetical protein